MFLYSLTGVLFGVAAILFFIVFRKKGMSIGRFIGSYALMFIGLAAITFSINWGYVSFLEGEPQAAAMGFLVFGGFGIVLAIIGLRIATLKKKTEEKTE